jgi:hypothetical protein
MTTSPDHPCEIPVPSWYDMMSRIVDQCLYSDWLVHLDGQRHPPDIVRMSSQFITHHASPLNVCEHTPASGGKESRSCKM